MSTGLRSFIPYTLWRHGWKYTKPKYYRHLIHRHLKQNPTASAKSIQNTGWSDGYFATIVSSIRQGIAKDMDDIKPQKFATNHLQAARELHKFFDGITEDDTIKILNKYCHLYLPKGSVKYGDCILAIKTVGEMLTSLTARYRSKVAQIAKQTILTSLARTDGNGHILNNEFIRNLGIWAYMKRNMEYQKADQLYKDKKNMIPTQYKPDLKLLGIPILFFARSNIPKPTDDHRMLNTNQITDTQMAMDVDDFKNNNTNNTNNTHVMGPPPRLEATWSPLMDQTTIYAFPGRGNTYDTLQRGSQRGGDANRGNQIMNIGVDYGGYTRINQRARSRSRSR